MSPHRQRPVTGFSVIAAHLFSRDGRADMAMNIFQRYAEIENAARCGGVAAPFGLRTARRNQRERYMRRYAIRTIAIAAAMAFALGTALAQDDDKECDDIMD